MAIAREAGARTKIAVKASTDGVNPKGALIGPTAALACVCRCACGERREVGIVDYSDGPAKVRGSRALSPAVATGDAE